MSHSCANESSLTNLMGNAWRVLASTNKTVSLLAYAFKFPHFLKNATGNNVFSLSLSV